MDNPSSKRYSPPIDQFLTLGDVRSKPNWLDYRGLGITEEHIPDLLSILGDRKLRWADSESVEVWAPVHAWRALGQLQAVEAIETLIRLLREIDEFDDDWSQEEIPVVFGMIGPASLPALQDYLSKKDRLFWASVSAAHSLAEVGKRHPKSRTACIDILRTTLEAFNDNDPTLNGFLISYLVELNAIEVAPLVEQAYEADRVDISIMGDYEDFQIALGLLEKRLTPPPRYQWFADPDELWKVDEEARREENLRKRQQAQKEKKKRKQAKKARRGKRRKKRK